MIGTIVTDLLAQLLELKEIGRLRIPSQEPLIYFEEGVMLHSSIILASEKHKIAVVLFSQDVPPESWYEVADFITEWSNKHGIRNICTIASYPQDEEAEGRKGTWFVAEKENYQRMLDSGVEPLLTGSIQGFHAAILDSALLDPVVDASVFFAFTDNETDADLASNLLSRLFQVFRIDTPENWMEIAKQYSKTLIEILADQESED